MTPQADTPAFTPGPWFFHPIKNPDTLETTDFYIQDESTHYIADVHIDVRKEYEGQGLANARLIAAAPDMLEALKAVLNSDMAMREEDEGRASTILNEVRRAVLKAEGEALAEGEKE